MTKLGWQSKPDSMREKAERAFKSELKPEPQKKWVGGAIAAAAALPYALQGIESGYNTVKGWFKGKPKRGAAPQPQMAPQPEMQQMTPQAQQMPLMQQPPMPQYDMQGNPPMNPQAPAFKRGGRGPTRQAARKKHK